MQAPQNVLIISHKELAQHLVLVLFNKILL